MLLKLFLIFIKIGAFTFGGGYAMIPLIKNEIVDKNQWLDEEEFLDIIAITQCAPGAVAINTAIYIGNKLKGINGAIVSALAVLLPSVLIILIIASLLTELYENKYVEKFFLGVRPAVVALIAMAGFRLSKKACRETFHIILAILGFVSFIIFDIHPILVIIVSAILGYFFSSKWGCKK